MERIVSLAGILQGVETHPVATPAETVQALLKSANRVQGGVPLRHTFVQQGTSKAPEPGPLATLVHHGDRRGLDLYLLLKAVASSEPYNSHRGAKVWARALRHTDVTASEQTITKIWGRLEAHRLITRSKHGRLADVTLLREDGSGGPYHHPATKSDRYLQLPIAYWLDDDEWWCATLSLPAKAMLLVALTRPNDFVMPVERVPDWYGMSADTAQRGIAELQRRGILTSRRVAKKSPLAPDGYTYARHFTLDGDFTQTWSTP